MFNLSSESMQKLNAKLTDFCEAGGNNTRPGWQDCFSCKGGSCTAGLGGD